MKLALGMVAIAALNAQSAQDPLDVLERARDQLLTRVPRTPKYVCTETIDRSYFSRKQQPITMPSCEQISIDRKKGRSKLQLDGTDRLRVNVAVTGGREIYSWTGPGSFSRGVDQILEPGPIGTGEFGVYLLDLFGNPAFRFRLLAQNETQLEFGFRVPVEGSTRVIRAGTEWRSAGYDGSFVIDPRSLELKRLLIETGELPPETSICEESTVIDYPPVAGKSLIPLKAQSHNLMRDTTETDRVSTFSNCRELGETLPANKPELAMPIPEGIPVELALTSPIDTATAATGDVVTARVKDPIRRLKSSAVLVPAGATVTGRIFLMEHHPKPPARVPYFLISIAFDALEVNGVTSLLHVRLDKNAAIRSTLAGSRLELTGREPERSSQGFFIFPAPEERYVVPAGFTSKWYTAAPTVIK